MAILTLVPNMGNSWIARFKIDLLTCSAGLELFLSIFYWTLLSGNWNDEVDFAISFVVHGVVFVLLLIDFCFNRANPSWFTFIEAVIVSLPYLTTYFVITNIFQTRIYSTDVIITDVASALKFSAFITALIVFASISTFILTLCKRLAVYFSGCNLEDHKHS